MWIALAFLFSCFCRDIIEVKVFLSDPEVNVMSHNALYTSAELFSYIGGLMGCWLGISVWASVGIFEKIWKFVRLKWQFRNKSRRLLPTRQKGVKKFGRNYERNM
ncbi:hypothetical protein TNCV_2231001 [Trichonephila clavipes]|nr:hypothetical protein TNCV_2231001 [Trichonephila clavipes]